MKPILLFVFVLIQAHVISQSEPENISNFHLKSFLKFEKKYVKFCESYTYKGIKYDHSFEVIDTFKSLRFKELDSLIRTTIYEKELRPSISVSIIPNTLDYIVDDEIRLEASGATHYLWSTNETDATIFHRFQYTTVISVIGWTIENCPDTVKINLKERPVIDLPAAFSPNGNSFEENKTLKPDYHGNVWLKVLDIYDRYGEKVFSTKNINQGWNGYYRGQLAMQGSYIYIMEYILDGVKYMKTGSVLLIYDKNK